jgi:hypothetical protein
MNTPFNQYNEVLDYFVIEGYASSNARSAPTETNYFPGRLFLASEWIASQHHRRSHVAADNRPYWMPRLPHLRVFGRRKGNQL